LIQWLKEAQERTTSSSNKDAPRFEIKNGMLFRKRETQKRSLSQLVSPMSLTKRVMKLGHESVMSGHQGAKKTSERVVAHFISFGRVFLVM